jgi:hypothetical protein
MLWESGSVHLQALQPGATVLHLNQYASSAIFPPRSQADPYIGADEIRTTDGSGGSERVNCVELSRNELCGSQTRVAWTAGRTCDSGSLLSREAELTAEQREPDYPGVTGGSITG